MCGNILQFVVINLLSASPVQVFYGHEINNHRLRYFSRLDHHQHQLPFVTVGPREARQACSLEELKNVTITGGGLAVLHHHNDQAADKLIIVDTRTSPTITSLIENWEVGPQPRPQHCDSPLDCECVCQCASVTNVISTMLARCLGGAPELPGVMQGRWNLLCPLPSECGSVTVLQCYIPATVGVSSCHRVTQAQLDSGDISAPPLLIWSISAPRNFWSEQSREEESVGGRSNIPPGGDNICCYITSAHTWTLSIILNTTHYHHYTINICMFTILCIPGLSDHLVVVGRWQGMVFLPRET